MWAGRTIDAIPCFRRAAKANTRGAEARFHLGEMLWQLGLTDEAMQSWRSAAQADAKSLAARLALAEAMLMHGDYAGARLAAAEALALAPADHRALASHSVAAAALGDIAALEAFAKVLSAQPDLSLLPAYATALARALELAPHAALRDDIVAKLLPLATNMPPVLLAPVVGDAFAHDPIALIEALRTRAWQRGDIDVLRRIIVAIHASEPALAQELAATYAAMCAAEPLQLPSLWPLRTGGASLRVAWLMPAPDSASFASACAVVRESSARLADADVRVMVACAGNVDETRAALPHLPPQSVFLPLPHEPDATHARALAGSDPDVLVDLAGLHVATGLFLAARPARNVWSLAAVVPGHPVGLVDSVYASTDELVGGLRALCGVAFPAAPSAVELAGWWDAAVRAHQQGDAEDRGRGLWSRAGSAAGLRSGASPHRRTCAGARRPRRRAA